MISLLLAAALWAGDGGADPLPAQSYWLYVAAESADEVDLVRFDAEQGRATVEKRIEVGYQPTEIEGPHGLCVSPDGRNWYLSMAHGKPFGLLYKYATGTDELLGEVELGLFPATMQISPATGLLYCVNFDLHGDMSPSSVSIVDVDEMVEVGRVTTGPMPHGSRVSPDGRYHYSCSMMGDRLYELDAVDFSISRELDLRTGSAAMPAGMPAAQDAMPMDGRSHAKLKPTWVYPHPFQPRVYVALNGAGEVVEVDLNHWKIIRRFATGKGPYNVEVATGGEKMVVSYKSEGAVGIWDLVRGVELARIPSSRKVTHGVAIAADGRYAFVTCEGIGGETGTVDVFDLKENVKVCTVEVGLQAGGIAFWKAGG
jgi:DNA-binding beta-propeller fold protein YncE